MLEGVVVLATWQGAKVIQFYQTGTVLNQDQDVGAAGMDHSQSCMESWVLWRRVFEAVADLAVGTVGGPTLSVSVFFVQGGTMYVLPSPRRFFILKDRRTQR